MFRDRVDAGRRLGEALRGRQFSRPYVLAIPRGGVVVGYEAAVSLDAPLDVIVPRKLRAPLNPELAIGAVAHDGSVYLDERLVKGLGVPPDYIEQERLYQQEEIHRRMRVYRGDVPVPVLAGVTAIVVDDGIATGSTMVAALRAVRRAGPGMLVAAVPVAPAESAVRLRQEVDEFVILDMPAVFYAVGQFYEDFAQTDDEEVVALLARRRRDLGADSGVPPAPR